MKSVPENCNSVWICSNNHSSVYCPIHSRKVKKQPNSLSDKGIKTLIVRQVQLNSVQRSSIESI